MSAYTTQASIQGQISPTDLIAALDDTGSGQLNVAVLNQIISDVSTDIDGMCGGLYNIPFNPVPPLVAAGCLAIVCYEIVRRALTPEEKNIYKEDADRYMKIFMEVRDDDKPFDVNTPRANSPVIIQQTCLSVDTNTF